MQFISNILKMKKHFVKLIIIGFLFICASCNDPLGLSNLNKIEAEGDWGIPLFNSKITLDYLFQKLDSVRYMQIGEDGGVTFVFESDNVQVLQGSDLLTPINAATDTIGTIPDIYSPEATYVEFNMNNLLNLNINSDQGIVHLATIQSGRLTINFTLPQFTGLYTIVLTSPQITRPNGQNLSFTLSSTTTSVSINLAGCTVRPINNNRITFNATISMQHPGGMLSGVSYHATSNLNNVLFNQFIGYLNPYNVNLDKAFETNLNFNKVTLNNLRFYAPNLTLYTQNSFCNASGTIQSIVFEQDDGSTHPFVSVPVDIDIPYSGSSFIANPIECVPSIVFDSHTDSIRFKGHFTLNPQGQSAGDVRISRQSNYHVKMKAEMPGNLSLENAIYRDTVPNALYDKTGSSIANNAKLIQLRISTINNLPMEFTPELSFIDTITHEVTEIDLSSIVIHGSYDGQEYVATPVYVNIQNDRIKKVTAAQKMVLNFKLSSANHVVKVNTDRYIKAHIGAKIQYSEFNF